MITTSLRLLVDGGSAHREEGSGLADTKSVGSDLQLIARDIATSERGRDDFPFIRTLTHMRVTPGRGNSDFFGHGNDQESSSEAINAWAALAFLGSLPVISR